MTSYCFKGQIYENNILAYNEYLIKVENITGEGDTEDCEDENERPTQHFVTSGDTLARIAAKYDVTPSELAQLNKLGMGRVIFPGNRFSE